MFTNGFKNGPTRASFRSFLSFQNPIDFTHQTVDFIGIRTRIVREEAEHADHWSVTFVFPMQEELIYEVSSKSIDAEECLLLIFDKKNFHSSVGVGVASKTFKR